MRQLDRPDIDLGALYTQCAVQKNSLEVRQRLNLAGPAILEAATQYEQLGQTITFYQFVHPAMPAGAAGRNDLIDLYQSTLVRKRGAGRWAYDKILASAPRGICPLCGQRRVSTLDHYLPKETHWALSITPDNLIPACRDCNYVKRTETPEDEGTQPFHPYFDVCDGSQWLFARIERVDGISIKFYVAAPPNWSPEKRLRARHHFELFDLGPFYATQAAEELLNLKDRLVKLHAMGGGNAVRLHLSEMALSCRQAHINSWQTALYQALSEDQAFYSGDFGEV